MRQKLDTLLDAHMPGNLDQFIGVVAMIISSSSSDAVRLVAKHHHCVSLQLINNIQIQKDFLKFDLLIN